jgi:uncharacterized protein
MADASPSTVQVVYALPAEQHIVDVRYRPGLTAERAVLESGLTDAFPEILTRPWLLGVFGIEVEASHVLAPGDRVEVCRPLQADPRNTRREIAATGLVMGARPKPKT